MLRGFTDSTGVEWRVWEVLPGKGANDGGQALSRSLKDSSFAHGWLCFESSAEKRRLAPIPPEWQFLDLGVLDQLRQQAALVPERKRRPSPAGGVNAQT